ncbi:MAG: hypothetical protein ACLRX5_06545 [Slackia sp.]
MDTDQPFEVLVAEFIREKMFAASATKCRIPSASLPIEIELRTSQGHVTTRWFTSTRLPKGIIIGKGGSAIKRSARGPPGSRAAAGVQVFLDLQVKVKKNWRRDLNQIRRFGYGEGI